MPDFIEYLRGDATAPEFKPAVIVHVCNDAGAWGKGFVKALSDRWSAPERKYREGCPHTLGTIQVVEVAKGVTVINMIAQHGIYSPNHPAHQERPLVYDALYRCLRQAAEFAKVSGAALHMPKIGANLAKGDWSIISQIILSVCQEYGVKAYVYTL